MLPPGMPPPPPGWIPPPPPGMLGFKLPPMPGQLPPPPPAAAPAPAASNPARPTVDLWGDLSAPSMPPPLPPAPAPSSYTYPQGGAIPPPPPGFIPPPPPGLQYGAVPPPPPSSGASYGQQYQARYDASSSAPSARYDSGMGGGAIGYGGGGNRPSAMSNNNNGPTNTVWLGGGIDRYPDSHYITVFAPFGKIMRLARLTPNKQTVFIHYRCVEEAQNAVREMTSRGILGPDIRVGYGKQQEYSPEEMAIPYNPSDPMDHAPVAVGIKRMAERNDFNGGDPYGNQRDSNLRIRIEHNPQQPSSSFQTASNNNPQRSNVLWVGEIPNSITTDELRQHFSAFNYRELSRNENKGIAFVHFETADECEHVMRARRDIPLRGYMLKLNYGTARKPREEYHAQYGITAAPVASNPNNSANNIDPSKETPTNRLFVGGLPTDIQKSEVDSIFGAFAGFLESRVMAEKHFAFIDFDSAANCATCRYALLPTPITIRGQTFRISFAKDGHNNTPIPPHQPSALPSLAPPAAGVFDFSSDIYGGGGASSAAAAGGGGAAGGAPQLVAPQLLPPGGAMSYLTRQREAPKKAPGIRDRAQALKGATYHSLAEGGNDPAKTIKPELVQDLCTAVDGTLSAEVEASKPLHNALTQHLPHKATHALCVIAKRLVENYNNDPSRKVAVMFVVMRCVMSLSSTATGNYSTEAVEAVLTLIGITAIEQQSQVSIDNIRKFINHFKSQFFTVGGARAIYDQSFNEKALELIKDIEGILSEQEDYLKLMM